jgi:hypothetical protein
MSIGFVVWAGPNEKISGERSEAAGLSGYAKIEPSLFVHPAGAGSGKTHQSCYKGFFMIIYL